MAGPPGESPLPRAGPAIAALTVLFAAVALVLIAFHWPAPFDDLGAWGLRAAAALASGAAAAALVWRAASYPRPPGGPSNEDTPPTS